MRRAGTLLAVIVFAPALVAGCMGMGGLAGDACGPSGRSEVSPRGVQGFPTIAGDYVVWASDESSDPVSPRLLHAYHVPSGRAEEIARTEGTITIPRTDGASVVWSDVHPGNRTWVLDLETGEKRVVPVPREPGRALEQETALAVHGPRVLVEQRYAVAPRYVHLVHDLATGETTRVANHTYGADLWGDRVVWAAAEPRPEGEHSLMLLDLATGERSVLASGATPFYQPSIHGDTVAYVQPEPNGTGAGDVHVLDLAGGGTRPVATGPERQSSPRVGGEYVIYNEDAPEGFSEENQTLRAFHLDTGADVLVQRGHMAFGPGDVWGRHVVFLENRRQGYNQVVLRCLPADP